MPNKLRERLVEFTTNEKQYPILAAFSAGLYPFLHYYGSNLSIADSWQQCIFLILICFVVPQLLVMGFPLIFKIKEIQFLEKYSLTVFNFCIFSVLLGVLIFNYQKKAAVVVIFISGILGVLLFKHLKKIILIQLSLGLMAFFVLIPRIGFMMQYENSSWVNLPEEEFQAIFKRTPNIFVIQPDGYVNFSILKTNPYNFDNSEFEVWLEKKGFKDYPNFRSNYYSTLTSNSSMFSMKHHYYANTDGNTLKTFDANDVIVGKDNNVLKILKQNNYRTHLITNNSFFLLNRRSVSYDFSNIRTEELGYHSTGRIKGVEILADFKGILDTLNRDRNFFFIEKTIPSHINYSKSLSLGKLGERQRYLERLEEANIWLCDLVNLIDDYDENALVIIVADHGGFVGMDYTMECTKRQNDEDVIYSIFSSVLAVKWPESPMFYDDKLKSNVNLFRILFSYLSENPKYLENLESDTSFVVLKEGAPFGVYQYIDEDGEPVFIKK